MAAVGGLRGTGDWGVDERPKNFREMILWLNPNGTTPIFALSARIGKESTDDPEFSWWDEPLDIFRLQVNGALTSGATTIVVDSGDPDAANLGARYGLATHLQAGDIIMVEPAADVKPFAPEYMTVVSVTNETTFVVTRGSLGSTAAAIADNAFLLKLGSTFAEGTRSPDAVSRNPVKYNNFTQIFKNTYELTGTARQTRARTGDPLRNDKKRRMFDHAQQIEQTLLFGRKSETTGANGKPLRSMDGIRRFIPDQNATIFGAALTVSSFLDATYKVFDFDSRAGDQRIVFAGNRALNTLNKVIQSDTTHRVTFGPTITQFGMNLRTYTLPQGTLFIRTHPLLNRHPLYDDSMWILDFSALRWRPMRGRDTRFKDNVQHNDEDTQKGLWMTEAGLEVNHGGLTLGYLGNVSA